MSHVLNIKNSKSFKVITALPVIVVFAISKAILLFTKLSFAMCCKLSKQG
ncbi:MAG: hypothetical protein P8H39_01495 [Thalassotalea sp.]|nr:hypothetical protein [Thalassotalea sp.]